MTSVSGAVWLGRSSSSSPVRRAWATPKSDQHRHDAGEAERANVPCSREEGPELTALDAPQGPNRKILPSWCASAQRTLEG